MRYSSKTGWIAAAAAAALVMVAGCSSVGPARTTAPAPIGASTAPVGGECNAQGAQAAVGKDATAKVAIPGGPRDPNFNPFLNPDPALTVGPIGEHHTIILNKFPLTARHLVLARRVFAEQLEPLNLADFTALALVMTEAVAL